MLTYQTVVSTIIIKKLSIVITHSNIVDFMHVISDCFVLIRFERNGNLL